MPDGRATRILWLDCRYRKTACSNNPEGLSESCLSTYLSKWVVWQKVEAAWQALSPLCADPRRQVALLLNQHRSLQARPLSRPMGSSSRSQNRPHDSLSPAQALAYGTVHHGGSHRAADGQKPTPSLARLASHPWDARFPRFQTKSIQVHGKTCFSASRDCRLGARQRTP